MAYIGHSASGNFTTKPSKDTFSGDGSTTAFTLSEGATTNTVDVFVENVRQEPTTAYTVDGTTLTFTAAPGSGTNNIYVVNRGPLQLSATHPAAQALEASTGTFTGDLTIPSINNGQIGGRRNLAFNGDMKIAQRGTQTGQTGNSYTACDRFLTAEGGAAVTTSSQSTDVPSGQGFANSLKIDITTADTDISANDFFILIQRLEGQDLQHLLYGTSGAKDLTISFWVKSPKTGTHILELRHNDATYYNAQAYTITSANTWQKVTLTYSGYTTTALDDDNNNSLAMQWWFAAGSNFSSGTLQSNTWQNTATNRAVGQVNCLDSTSNEIYLTGVQLEVGSVATEFEHRSFGEELALCQRYFQDVTLGNRDAFRMILTGQYINSTTFRGVLHFTTAMRANPSMTISGNFELIPSSGNLSSISLSRSSHVRVDVQGTSSVSQSAGYAASMRTDNDTTATMFLDAEL